MELPLRAKYCKELKAVVEEFDHYCPFVYNAIGRRNYHYFFWYIHVILCAPLEAYSRTVPSKVAAVLISAGFSW